VPDVNTIVDKANLMAYYQGDDGKARVKMVITDKEGRKRNREFIILRKDVKDGEDQMYYVYFRRPADVRDMVYLVHKHAAVDKDDDRWLYLPALDLVKRIAAGDKRTSFVGSDFLYEDVSGRGTELDRHELIKTTEKFFGSDFLYEDVSGRGTELDRHELIKTTEKFFVVKNVPKKPEMVEFAYYNVWIDRKTYMPMKMEYYDKHGKLYRVIESKEVKKIEGLWTVVKSVASNLKTGSETEMEFLDVDYNIKLGDIFKERYLRRPPRQVRR